MNNNQPKFDGAKWRCPKCESVLATVVQGEEFRLPTMESKPVTLLELPAGYIKSEDADEYIKPGKTLPFMRGAANKKQRIKKRKFTERQLEVAQSKGDFVSASEARRKLAQVQALAAQASQSTADAARKRLHAEELPASIKCAKPGCNGGARLTSIRALPNMAQRGIV